MMWQPIETAASDRPVELCVIDSGDVHALAFPCRRSDSGWINEMTKAKVDVSPTHWRDWSGAAKP